MILHRNTYAYISLKSVIVVFALLFCNIGQLMSTHIVGGEMNYVCLGNDQYEITLTVFRDCENGIPNFDDPAHIGIFGDDNERVENLGDTLGVVNIEYILDDTLDPTLFDSCLVVPPNVCVDVTTYVDTVTLPFRTGGYNIVYQRCCRNHTIDNIISPDSTGATYSIYITERALIECNSNAVFKYWPPNYICRDKPILFDHAAIDPDGDSLVYKLCTPFHGGEFSCYPNSNLVPNCFDPDMPCGPRPCPPFNPPFDSVVWKSPYYGIHNMLGGIPLAIDSETGFLTGTPDSTGQYVVGVCVEEYRNGELISVTKRDFQYNVGVCGQVISSFFAPAVDCDGFTVDFDNQSENAPNYVWDFGDPNTTNDISIEQSPSYTYPDTGSYDIRLIAGPNELCVDTSYSTISVQYPSLFVDFDLSIDDGCVFPAQVTFNDLTYDTISTLVEWDWQFSNGENSDEQNPIWYVTEPGVYQAVLTVTAANGCQVSHSDIISIDVLNLGLQDSAMICIGDEAILNPGTDPSYSYTWSPASTLDDPNSPSPTAMPLSSTTYYLTVEDNQGCTFTDSVKVEVNDVDVLASGGGIECEEEITISANSNQTQDLEWYADSLLTNFVGTGNEITVTPGEGNTYYVVATDDLGCSSSSSVTVGSSFVNLDVPPAGVICSFDTLILAVNNLNPNDILTYQWSPEENIISGQGTDMPAFFFESDQTVSLIAENQNGCLDTFFIPISVEQNTLELIATADPDSIYPGESSQLNADSEIAIEFLWTNGGVLDDNTIYNPIATPLETTTFTVFANDEAGCRDTANVTVYLKSFLCLEPYIFVPNAFTPDGDGRNDIFYVRGNAIDEMYIAVFNRWGEKVFESNSLENGWDGTYKGKELPPDVFGYYLELKCLNGEEYFKKGNVTLIR